ncbi:putative Alpha-ribazole phosphatase (Anaerobic pathway of cobalamin biosynthesis, cobC) [Bradyrhizobium sp. STM 3843]|uniref:histidine phosphatase family protein n=1 Tax=Bradyrhizobium sp. STM 3843 TaxID=551947 RepID=UPI000240AA4B|nr:histidine phosphatase family protein [Bradyrhizobium sp. STM 3843]CCE05306.1 putative Alpha-ribazole phosphatase (Anaerobic pathway of cobalamin biosynthesis, cobC) [Bradyrhizobium sp. STM 3843]
MRIDLLRHGDTGRDGYLDGRTDPPLSQTGSQQFATQTKYRDWKLIVSSPLVRARSAAEKHSRRMATPLQIDPDWRELDFGRWDGRERREIATEPGDAALLEAFYADPAAFTAPEGESWTSLQHRVGRALDRLTANPELSPVLVVTHGGAIRAALSLVLGWPLRSLWSLRIKPATRITLEIGRGEDGALWGELVEIIQP